MADNKRESAKLTAQETEDFCKQAECQAKITEELQKQLKLRRDMTTATGNIGEQAAIQQQALNATSEATRKATESTNDMNKALQESASTQQDLTNKTLQSSEAHEVFSKATGGVFDKIKGGVMALGDFIKKTYELGKQFFAIYSGFAIFDHLREKYSNLPVLLQFREAKEDVREFAGDLKTGQGKIIMDAYANLKKSTQGWGLSIGQVVAQGGVMSTDLASKLTRGDASAAMQLREVKDVAEKLGQSFVNLGDKFTDVAGAAIMAGRALGIGNEGAAEFYKTAEAIGVDGAQYLRDFTKEANKSLQAYGFSSKIMGKGMSELMKTLPHLQREGAKAFAPIVAYAQKMGLELKQVTGILDTFSSADKAVEAASALAQMGVAIDPLVMVAEKDPSKQLNMITDAFRRTGKAIDFSDRHTRGYLKSIMNMDDATLDRVASENGLGNAYDKTRQQAEKAQKIQKSQAEVMRELGNNIKRVVAALDIKMDKGFFDKFLEGIDDGFYHSRKMVSLGYQLKDVFTAIYQAGYKVGGLLLKFPGVSEMVAGIGKLINPEGTRGLLAVVVRSFEKLMDILNSGKATIGDAAGQFKRMFSAFSVFSEERGNFFSNTIEGIKKFAKAIGPAVGGFFKFLFDEAVIGIKKFTQQIGGSFKNIFEKATETGGDIFNTLFNIGKDILLPIFEAFKEGVPALLSSMKELISTGFSAGTDDISNTVSGVMGWFSDVFKNMREVFQQLSSGVSSGPIGSAWKNLTDEGSKLITSIFSGGDFEGTIGNYFEVILGKMKIKIRELIDDLKISFAETMAKGTGLVGTQMRGMAAALYDSEEIIKGFDEQQKIEFEELNEAVTGYSGEQLNFIKQIAEQKAKQRRDAEMSALEEKYKPVQPAVSMMPKPDAAGTLKELEENGKMLASSIQTMTADVVDKTKKSGEEITKAEQEKQLKMKAEKLRTVADVIAELKNTEAKIGTAQKQLDSLMKKDSFKKSMEKFQKDVKSLFESLGPIMTEMGNVSTAVPANLKTNVADMSIVFTQLGGVIDFITGKAGKTISDQQSKNFKSRMDRVAASIKGASDVGEKNTAGMRKLASEVNVFVDDIITAQGKLAQVGDIKTLAEAFKGGTLNVSHNLPNTTLNIAVQIDAKNLGAEILRINYGYETDDRYPVLGAFEQQTFDSLSSQADRSTTLNTYKRDTSGGGTPGMSRVR